MTVLGLDPAAGGYKYIGFYIYLINFIRFIGAAPEVTLYRCPPERDIPVDLVLDIGNSRTCGLLFEDGDFTRAAMLTLRDISDPSKSYEHPFDMRLVFRQADFGGDIVIEEEDMFRYSSLVRVGDEARKLVYRSVESEGLWASTTNYSSPKRYLWDNKLFKQKWEFLTTDSDPLYIREAENVYVPGLSDLFDAAGEFVRDPFNMLGEYRRAHPLLAFVADDLRAHRDFAAGPDANQQPRIPSPSRPNQLQAYAPQSHTHMPHSHAA